MKTVKIVAGVLLVLFALQLVVVNILPAVPNISRASDEELGEFAGRCTGALVLVLLAGWAFMSAAKRKKS
jgi:hypothetical protein